MLFRGQRTHRNSQMKILITNTDVLNGGDAAMLQALLARLRGAFGDATRFVVYVKHPKSGSRLYPGLIFRKWLYLSVMGTLDTRPRRDRFRKSIFRKHLSLLRKALEMSGRFCAKIRSNGRAFRPLFPSVCLLGVLIKHGPMSVLSYANLGRFWAGAWCVRHRLSHVARLFLTAVELRDLEEYSSADLVIAGGGTNLVEHYGLSAHIVDYETTLYLKRPLVFFTQSLGPFSSPSNRVSLKRIFERSILILLRDKKSLEHVTDLGVKNVSMYVMPDGAFALADADAIDAAANNTADLPHPIQVAVCVREWRYFKRINRSVGMVRYVEAIRALTVHLVKKYDARITYISTTQAVPEYWTDDSKTASEIVETLPAPIKRSVTVDGNFHSPENLREMLRRFDIVIATRMHMAILALSVGVPVLPIAYEFKTLELFKRLGHERWVQDIENISAASLIDATNSFLREIPQMRKSLFTAVKREREHARKSVGLIKRAFEEWRELETSVPAVAPNETPCLETCSKKDSAIG